MTKDKIEIIRWTATVNGIVGGVRYKRNGVSSTWFGDAIEPIPTDIRAAIGLQIAPELGDLIYTGSQSGIDDPQTHAETWKERSEHEFAVRLMVKRRAERSDAINRRDRKTASLKKQIARLEKLTFEETPE